MPTELGIDRLWIAFTSARLDETEVAERIASMLVRYGADAAQVRKLAAIPRNANGKIRRDLLKSELADAAAARAV